MVGTQPVRTGMYTDVFVDLLKRNAQESTSISVWMHRGGADYGTPVERCTIAFGDAALGHQYNLPWPELPADFVFASDDPDSPILQYPWPRLLENFVKKGWISRTPEVVDLFGGDLEGMKER